jgi:hypothetical protein
VTDAYFYSNVAIAGTIGNPGGINNSVTSVYLTTTPSGYPGSFPFKLRLDPNTGSEEVVKVTAGAGTSGSPWTIVRGWDGTTAVSHAAAAVVQHGMSAEDLKLSRDHEAAGNPGSGSGPHGLPASAWLSPSFGVIAETTLGSASPTITFSSIPSTFAHLVVVFKGRTSDTSGFGASVLCTLNGDSSAVYSWSDFGTYNLGGATFGPGVNFTGQYNQTSWNLLACPSSRVGGASTAGGGWALLPAYTATGQDKNFIGHSAWGLGNSPYAVGPSIFGGDYAGAAAAITSLSLAPSTGNFVTGTFAGLYGFGA